VIAPTQRIVSGAGRGVRPDRPEVDQRRQPEQRSSEAEAPTPAVADRHERHEEEDAESHSDRDGDEPEQHLIFHSVPV